MKTALLRTTILLALTIAFVGCGSSKGKLSSSSAPVGPAIVVPDAGTGGGLGAGSVSWPYAVSGETVAFVPVSWQEMNSYVGLRPLNNPSDAKINMQFKSVNGLNIFSGTVRIGYTDTNQFYYGEFAAGNAQNATCKNCQNNGDYEAAYNYWTTINGKRTFMAYFQDKYGSIIVVLEDTLSTGDASGSSILSGRVFYRNFAQVACPNNLAWNPLMGNNCDQSPYRKCWYIYSGPYACYSSVMASKSSSTVIDGYTLLGSFSGVQSFKAFE